MLLSITNNCETLIEQTHKKAEETFDFKLTKPKQMYHIKTPIQIQGSRMIVLTGLEVYNSFFYNRRKY